MKYFNIDSSHVKSYEQNDFILKLEHPLKHTTISRWLNESLPKRCTYGLVYESMFKNDLKDQRILDIGGGLSYFTGHLLEHFPHYHLCDILAHDDENTIKEARDAYGPKIIEKDWREVDFNQYDVIIANDIFPNVDQRLEIFLNKVKNNDHQLKTIVSLTCYDNLRSYKTKRLDGEEIFWFAGWTTGQLKGTLQNQFPEADSLITEVHKTSDYSLYPNGRTVYFLEF